MLGEFFFSIDKRSPSPEPFGFGGYGGYYGGRRGFGRSFGGGRFFGQGLVMGSGSKSRVWVYNFGF